MNDNFTFFINSWHNQYLPLKFLKEELLPYFNQWEKSVEERKGFKKGEKKRMLLSQETLDGIHITSRLHCKT